jgi:hypothetical protein
LAKLIQAGGNILRSDIHKLINSIWNKEEFPEQWKESIIVPIYKKGNKTDCVNCLGIFVLSTTYRMLSNIQLHMQTKLFGIFSMDFDVIDQQLIRYSAFVRLKKKWEYNKTVYKLFIDFKKAYDWLEEKCYTTFSLNFIHR